MPVEYVKKGHVAIITMNRPEARNAINGEMAATMEAALDQMESDPEVWVGILTAVGKAFCAGADLKEISAGNGGALSTKKGGFAGIAKRERTKPLIAAITGSALAGGTEIALSCDMIVAADDTNFGLPEVKRSLVAGAGGLFRLPRQIGKAVALEAILTGDPLSSQRAYELGMVNKVVPEADVMAEAEKLAGRITANAPLAVAASRAVAISATAKTDEELWKDSGVAFASIINTEDYKEGPKAFIEKRAPVWKGK
ncbi:enoyl-CoA hydratase/isomerase family protein [Hyphomonas neptunium ATCC 15444]|uniref:Enoyl-CoA hydratase/isomerase family protein n=2 Tax=Hyphomonas TaxID=85 RepID=Q0C2Z3_HYPNA|nr:MULTISPECIES: crotonase/enoyl-CoA hydratase family protein [Hyphomonas]ABI77811.1 enoyl-CoA hydratase/isomerase family protein [Hyphomonas neptunium ATCC 15444]KCZ95865.1 enoyl-CoA hydratase/isomerase family protein [Hyphomonas hirschiana VP5]